MNPEQREKINWLNRAYYADKKAQALESKLVCDRNLAQRISRNSAGTGCSRNGNGTEEALIRLAETERKMQQQLQELVSIREEIIAAIEQIEAFDLQTVLMWRYLHYLTFEQIADKMHYHVRTIRRKHKKAIEKIVL